MTYTLPPARSPLSFVRILQWTTCIALAALLYWWLEPSNTKEVVNWRPTLDAAQLEALKTNKLVFADFSASWCGPCQEMRRELWSDKKVASSLETFVPVQIDVDQNRAIAARYGIEGIPAFFLLDHDGMVLRRSEGGMSRSDFLFWLNHRKG